MPICSYENLEQRPYKKSNLITPNRFDRHVLRCPKLREKENEMGMNALSMNGDKVPNSTNDEINSEMKQVHFEKCSDKKSLPQLRVIDGNNVDDEDWESDQISTPYDPAAEMIKKPIPRKPPTGSTKSEKRKFRQEEHARIRKLLM